MGHFLYRLLRDWFRWPVVGLELPLAIGIAFLLGIVRASDAEMIARFRGAREAPRR